MSFDPSRTPYTHPTCGTLPCSCERPQVRLEFQLFTCPQCPGFAGYTVTELGNHRLAMHEHPLPLHADVPISMNGIAMEEGSV